MTIDDKFTINGREFTRTATDSFIWLSPDGWRFWLGQEVQSGVWTMGCDVGERETAFTFGIFDSVAECLTEHERKVG